MFLATELASPEAIEYEVQHAFGPCLSVPDGTPQRSGQHQEVIRVGVGANAAVLLTGVEQLRHCSDDRIVRVLRSGLMSGLIQRVAKPVLLAHGGDEIERPGAERLHRRLLVQQSRHQLGYDFNSSGAKAERVLGWTPRPIIDSLQDSAESILAHETNSAA